MHRKGVMYNQPESLNNLSSTYRNTVKSLCFHSDFNLRKKINDRKGCQKIRSKQKRASSLLNKDRRINTET